MWRRKTLPEKEKNRVSTISIFPTAAAVFILSFIEDIEKKENRKIFFTIYE